MNKTLQYLGDETGASAAEYALILALICVAIFVALQALSTAISGAVKNTANVINAGASS